MTITYFRGAELPALSLWVIDDDDALVDFSSGYTFEFLIGETGETPMLTKTTGITGAAGAGVEPTGTPNISVAWAADDLDFASGRYSWQITATTGGLDRVFGGVFDVVPVIG